MSVQNDARANALDEQTAARAEFKPLRANSALAPLVPPLLRFYHSEHTATKTAQAAIEDQVLAQNLRQEGRRLSLLLPWLRAGSASAH